EPLVLDPKAGLGLVNGDNFSTALACLLAVDTLHALLVSTVSGALAVQVLDGSVRPFHPMLSELRRHVGQSKVAAMYRYLLCGSDLSHQDMWGPTELPAGVQIQDVYSLRCIPQYHAFNVERLGAIFDAIEINANSVSDNPLWVAPEYALAGEQPWRWLSGGNFLGLYMAGGNHSLPKNITPNGKVNEPHPARLVEPHFSRGLPANLSDPASVTQCAFKGVQIQAGMLDVYSSLLSMPVTTFFGTHEENNQDVTSHALTSGILALENLRLARYSIAQNLLALAQAVDLRGGPHRLSPKTRPAYEFIRSRVRYVDQERPLNKDIEFLYERIRSGAIMTFLRAEVLDGFQHIAAAGSGL